VNFKRFTTDGVVISRRNYSEADRLLKVYTKHFGKLTLIGKGIRKPKSRKRGSLEVFSHIKFAAATGRNMGIMTEVEIVNSFEAIRKNLKKVALAYFYLEVIDKLTQEGEKNAELFDFLLQSFDSLSNEGMLKKAKDDYIVGVLEILGFWPKMQKLANPNEFLESITERRLTSSRVGKKLLS
jgi:DNA repair protein RecO (recombination protein O)